MVHVELLDEGPGVEDRVPSATHRFKTSSRYAKYRAYTDSFDIRQFIKQTPSQHLRELTEPPPMPEGWRPRPKIIEFLNMADYTHQLDSRVGVDEPLFQPFPPEIVFYHPNELEAVEATLWLRNNDNVARRVKVLKPSSPHLEVFPVARKGRNGPIIDGNGKVAAGMEIAFTVRLTPPAGADFATDLVLATEREKFLVPVRAIGARACLDLPDVVAFEPTPAKESRTRPLLIRNVGTRAGSFELRASGPYSVSPTVASLDVEESLQIVLGFAPDSSGSFPGELEVCYEGGRSAFVELRGDGVEVDVSLSASRLDLLATFIHTQSQRTLLIHNRSGSTVGFDFRKNPTASADDDERAAVIGTLRASLGPPASWRAQRGGRRPQEESLGFGFDNDGDNDDDAAGSASGSEAEEAALAARGAELTRELRGRTAAVQAGRLPFESRAFSISPCSGQVWPGCTQEVTVTFTPERAGSHEAVAWCELGGRSDRLPLLMRGSGVGPTAVFTFDSLDLGSNYLGALHRYEVELHNRGQVDAAFEICPSDRSPFARSFSFDPASGLLRPEERATITVNFACATLGDFTERFECAVTGAAAPLRLEFRGSVVGPSFDVILPEGSHDGRHETLDFGTVAFGMLYSRIVVIHNTSEVPMRFAVRCQQGLAARSNNGESGSVLPRGGQADEFTLEPAEGAIPAGARQRIRVDLVSRAVRRYADRFLVFDVPGVANAVKRVALAAECAAPRIALKGSGELEFPECFLRHPCRATAVLVNQTRLPARFEVEPQSPASAALGTFTAEPQAATIPPMQECAVEFTLESERLGPIRLPASVRVLGSAAAPLRLTLSAHSQGPGLRLSPFPPGGSGDAPPEGWAPAFAFGKVQVLQEHAVTLYVTNTSPIPAELRLFMDGRDSLFSASRSELRLSPGESAPLAVTATLDDSVAFSDTLHVLVAEGPELEIPVEAHGVGSCVRSSEPLDSADFGHQLTQRTFERAVVLSNMGRRPVALAWLSSVQAAREQAAKEQQGKPPPGGGARKRPTDASAGDPGAEDLPPPIFQVQPPTATLQPRQQCTFLLQGRSDATGPVAETLICKALLGKASTVLYEVAASASLSRPMLEASRASLVFRYQHSPGAAPGVVAQELSLTNVSPIPLSFHLKAAPPFSVESPQMHLGRGETASTAVFFDVGSFSTAECSVTKAQLTIHYADHAQRDTIDLTGNIQFPNLALSARACDFGVQQSETVHRLPLLLTNTSQCDAAFSWALAADDDAAPPGPALGALFDVLPIAGTIPAGEQLEVIVTYHALPGRRASAWAVCSVAGGPDYEVSLRGEASEVAFALDPPACDAGTIQYDLSAETDVALSNSGRVAFDWRVDLSALRRQGVVEVSPMSGTLQAGQKAALRCRVAPGVPDVVEESFRLHVGHLKAVEVPVRVEGTTPPVLLNLPRTDDDAAKAAADREARPCADTSPARSPALPSAAAACLRS